VVARLRRAVHCILKDLPKSRGNIYGKTEAHSISPGIAEAGLFAGARVPIDQDHVPPALLQVQGRADADHARPQDEDVGLEFRPSGTPVQFARLHVSGEKLVIAAPPRKTSLRGGQNSGTMQLTSLPIFQS